jgi:hypothetical protein
MANTFATSTIILKEMLAVLAQKPTFLNTINRQYNSAFSGNSQTGAAVGDTVSVRIPQRTVMRTGRVMNVQPIVQQTMPVALSFYTGADTGINSLEQTLDIDNFRELVIKPKAADLIAKIESDILGVCVPKIPQYAGDWGLFNDRSTALSAGVLLDNNLAPMDKRYMLTNPGAGATFVEANAAIFNNQSKIANQYDTGRMGKGVLGFDWDSTTLIPPLTRGTANTAYVTNSVPVQTGTSLAVDTGSGTFKAGDIITIAGVNAVHPQSKTDLGYLQEFVIAADSAGGSVTLTLQAPGIVLTGSEQNVTAGAADGVAVTIAGSSGLFQNSIAYCEDAFYAVFADLPNPKDMGVDCSVMTWNGIRLRYMQGWDIVNDQLLSRFDCLYGGGILRPQLSVRIPNSLS